MDFFSFIYGPWLHNLLLDYWTILGRENGNMKAWLFFSPVCRVPSAVVPDNFIRYFILWIILCHDSWPYTSSFVVYAHMNLTGIAMRILQNWCAYEPSRHNHALVDSSSEKPWWILPYHLTNGIYNFCFLWGFTFHSIFLWNNIMYELAWSVNLL